MTKPIPLDVHCAATYPWVPDTSCTLSTGHDGDHADHAYDAPSVITWAPGDNGDLYTQRIEA